jgi:hypothetical protein
MCERRFVAKSTLRSFNLVHDMILYADPTSDHRILQSSVHYVFQGQRSSIILLTVILTVLRTLPFLDFGFEPEAIFPDGTCCLVSLLLPVISCADFRFSINASLFDVIRNLLCN